MVSAIGVSEINTGLLGAIIVKFVYDRFFKKGSILDSEDCKNCRGQLDSKIESNEKCLEKIERHSRIQTLTMLKMCNHMGIEGCSKLESLMEE